MGLLDHFFGETESSATHYEKERTRYDRISSWGQARKKAASVVGKWLARRDDKKGVSRAHSEGSFPGAEVKKIAVGGIRGWLSRWLTKGIEQFPAPMPKGKRGEGVPAEGEFTPWERGTVLPPEEQKEIGPEEMRDFLEDQQPLFVQSSNVYMLQYFPDAEKLTVEYRNGRSYIVSNISPEEALEFAQAQSKGSWVWTDVRGDAARAMPSTPGPGGRPPGPAPHIKPYERIK